MSRPYPTGFASRNEDWSAPSFELCLNQCSEFALQKYFQKTGLMKTNDKWSVRRGISLSDLIIGSHSIPGLRESPQALRHRHAEDQVGERSDPGRPSVNVPI